MMRRGSFGGFFLFLIKDGDGRREDVGQAIWLRRPDIKASYLAHGRVGNRYRAAAKAGGVVLVTTGGFTSAQSLPEGLTIDAGRLVNAMIMHDRHGLVMVSNLVNVLNLREHGFQLPRGRLIGNPLASLVDYSELLRWANQHQATLFQTQLLASGDALLIDPSRAKREQGERRINPAVQRFYGALVIDGSGTATVERIDAMPAGRTTLRVRTAYRDYVRAGRGQERPDRLSRRAVFVTPGGGRHLYDSGTRQETLWKPLHRDHWLLISTEFPYRFSFPEQDLTIGRSA